MVLAERLGFRTGLLGPSERCERRDADRVTLLGKEPSWKPAAVLFGQGQSPSGAERSHGHANSGVTGWKGLNRFGAQALTDMHSYMLLPDWARWKHSSFAPHALGQLLSSTTG